MNMILLFIALFIYEFQRIHRDEIGVMLDDTPFVTEQLYPLGSTDTEMVRTFRTYIAIGFHLFVIHQRETAGTLYPVARCVVFLSLFSHSAEKAAEIHIASPYMVIDYIPIILTV